MIGLFKYCLVGVGELIPAPFNPEVRTDERSLEELTERTRLLDGIIQPVVVSRDMRIIDGHRRWEVAKRLGYKEIPCLITPLGLQEGWAALNVSSMPINGRQYVYAVAHGLSDAYLPAPQRRKVRRLQELTGNRFVEIADAGLSTTVLDAVNRIGAVTKNKADDWLRCVLFWLVKHKMQLPVRKLIDEAIETDKLPEAAARLTMAVRSDRPLTRALSYDVQMPAAAVDDEDDEDIDIE